MALWEDPPEEDGVHLEKDAVPQGVWVVPPPADDGLSGLRLKVLERKAGAGGNPAKPPSGPSHRGMSAITWLAALSAERLGYKQYAAVARVGACKGRV